MLESLLLSDAQETPKAVQLFFFCAGFVFLIADMLRSRAARQRWKLQTSNKGKRYKMSKQERIKFRLYNLGWVISWALGGWNWWMRAAFGALSLVAVVGLLHQIDFRSEDAPAYDEASTLHLQP